MAFMPAPGSMADKVVLVTGAARGMGRVTARALAAAGARVILVDWQGEDGTRTRDEINRRSARHAAEFLYCDLAARADVHRLADEVLARYDRLDVLVNNAGITDPVYRLSPDGVEMHLATCHLGHFLLTQRLLGLLQKSAPSRIVVVSSEAHKTGPGLDFDDMNNAALWKGRPVSHTAAFGAYHRAKLCNLLFVRGQAARLAGSGVTINALSPGYFVNTSIYRDMRGIFRLGCGVVFGIGALLRLNTAESGAQTHLYLAASPDVEGVSGRYFAYCREARPGGAALDEALAARLWQWSQSVTGLD